MKNQRGSTTLIVMLVVAGAALLLGFLVMFQRIKNKPAETTNSDPSASQTQASDQPAENQTSDIPAQTPTDWIAYTNTKYNFSLRTPPSLKSGAVSGNSVLGTYQDSVKGFHVGPLVLVVLKDAAIKQEAQDYFNGFYDAALHPQPAAPSEGPTATCKIDKINNTAVSIKSVTCEGEGGPARYAYIKGSSYDVFVDGYSGGYDNLGGDIPPGRMAASDYLGILATFKFGATATTTTAPVTKTDTTTTTTVIQTFSVAADDNGATPAAITVPKGAIVQITFNVAATNVYYGGLDFRSSVVNSGTVYSGQSKTISFTANESFSFTPYWPASNIAKSYTINVTVQ